MAQYLEKSAEYLLCNHYRTAGKINQHVIFVFFGFVVFFKGFLLRVGGGFVKLIC